MKKILLGCMICLLASCGEYEGAGIISMGDLEKAKALCEHNYKLKSIRISANAKMGTAQISYVVCNDGSQIYFRSTLPVEVSNASE